MINLGYMERISQLETEIKLRDDKIQFLTTEITHKTQPSTSHADIKIDRTKRPVQ